MENMKIKQFLSVNYGDGSGSGSGFGSGDGSGYGYADGSYSGSGYGSDSGSGYGDGYGSGYGSDSGSGSGFGSGDGSGYGYADGSGDGSGYGDNIKSFNGEKIYYIDNTPTVIRAIHGDFAKGFVLRKDLTLAPCFIAKRGGYFAHGKTLREAYESVLSKLFDDMPEDERIEAFVEAHELKETYPNSDFFEWHHRLTGSCEMGRREFTLAHGIDVEHGSMTVAEFIALTENDYGGDTIRKLRRYYACTN